MIVQANPRQELSQFYPPPYNFLGPARCRRCGLVHTIPLPARGMGDTSSQVNSIVSTGASATTSLLLVLGTITGPVGAAIGAVIAVASLIASMFGHGCGSSCILASNDANKIEPLLQQNLQAYLSSPVHYKSLQAAALNNFDTIWNALQTACGDPSLGAAGKRCVTDRQQGSCAYHTTPGGWQNGTYVYPGANNSGQACWNWFIGYRDPIANDPTVVPDPTPTATPSSVTNPSSTGSPNQTVTPQTSTTGFNLNSLILPGLLIGGGLLVASLID